MAFNFSKTFITIAFSYVFIFSVIGCEKNKNMDKVLIMKVASKKVENTTTSIAPKMALNVKIEGDDRGWFAFINREIQGFEYKEGFEYILKVNQVHLKNPRADGSSNKYVLIEVLSKTKDDNVEP